MGGLPFLNLHFQSFKTDGRMDTHNQENFTEDGWFKTGDVSTIDEEGYMQITDRTKDLIKSGGEWISSVASESVLMSHPKVREAAVVAIPDKKFGGLVVEVTRRVLHRSSKKKRRKARGPPVYISAYLPYSENASFMADRSKCLCLV